MFYNPLIYFGNTLPLTILFDSSGLDYIFPFRAETSVPDIKQLCVCSVAVTYDSLGPRGL